MKNKERIKDLTYAAMMVAIFVAAHFIFPANNSGIQSLLSTITPIPIAVYCSFVAFRKSITVCAAAFFLTLLFFDPVMVVSFIVPSLIFGAVLGAMLKKGLSFWKMLLLICLSIGFNLYEIYLNCLITGVDFIEVNLQSVQMSVDVTAEFFESINKQMLFDLNVAFLPLMLIIGGTLKTVVTCYLSVIIVERLYGRKVEHFELEYYTSSSIYIEVAVLSIYTVTVALWTLILTDIIPYLFIYSVLLDLTLFFVLFYYGMIHRKITKGFADNKVRYFLISILFMSMFFIISPVAAISKIVKKRRSK